MPIKSTSGSKLKEVTTKQLSNEVEINIPYVSNLINAGASTSSDTETFINLFSAISNKPKSYFENLTSNQFAKISQVFNDYCGEKADEISIEKTISPDKSVVISPIPELDLDSLTLGPIKMKQLTEIEKTTSKLSGDAPTMAKTVELVIRVVSILTEIPFNDLKRIRMDISMVHLIDGVTFLLSDNE